MPKHLNIVNLQQRRNERKMKERSLEKFTTNSAHSTLKSEGNCRSRINSVFRLKLRDLHEVRSKKNSQSMVRSKEISTHSNSSSPNLKNFSKNLKTKISTQIETLDGITNQNRQYNFRVKKEDQVYSNNLVRNSIHDIITPVVQISYNQIKSVNKSKSEVLNPS